MNKKKKITKIGKRNEKSKWIEKKIGKNKKIMHALHGVKKNKRYKIGTKALFV